MTLPKLEALLLEELLEFGAGDDTKHTILCKMKYRNEIAHLAGDKALLQAEHGSEVARLQEELYRLEGVEASRQRMLEYEESKSESVSEMKKSKQDLQSLGEEDLAPWQGSQIAELRAEKDAAVGALLAAQAELRESKEIVKEGNSVLADRLVVLEESVIFLRTERDVLSGSLVEMEKSLTPGSDNSLKDEGTSVETVPASDDMRDSIPVDSNNLRSLIAKLEHAVLETFPDSASELVSLRVAKPAFEYWKTLCDKLLNGDTGVCHQLQKAHLQLTESDSC
ncbi:hypothetical protein R1flu_004362 [Riccia fluitans]|uniref:Uncharacterized protein n=1 Tax=Riccia fluitans TaxID=41844 RepID=A0ABD1YQ37_9MARC